MSSKLRLALPMACIGVVGAACFLLLQSHASARVTMNYAHLNKIQKRIISETLASALGPPSSGAQAHVAVPISDDGSGPDGAPFTPPEVVRLAGRRRVDDQLLPVLPGKLLGEPRQQRQGQPELPEPHRPQPAGARPGQQRAIDLRRSVRSASTRRQRQQLHPRRRNLRLVLLPGRRPDVGQHDDPERLHERHVVRPRVLAGRRRHVGGVGHARERVRELPAVQPRHSGVGEPRSVEHVRGVPGDPERRRVVELPRALLGDVHVRPDRHRRRAAGQGPDGDRRQRQQPVPRPHLRDVDGLCR